MSNTIPADDPSPGQIEIADQHWAAADRAFTNMIRTYAEFRGIAPLKHPLIIPAGIGEVLESIGEDALGLIVTAALHHYHDLATVAHTYRKMLIDAGLIPEE